MMNFQDDVYQKAIDSKKVVKLILKSGVHIQGEIIATDKFTVLIESHGQQQLVYKQVISTIIN